MFLILLNIFKNIVIEHGKDSWSFKAVNFSMSQSVHVSLMTISIKNM